MSIELIDLILLLGAAQGLFLTVLIFHKHGRPFANRYLGTMILLYSVLLLHLLFEELGYAVTYPHLMLLILGLGFLPGPLHFLYAKYLVSHATRFRKADCLHFLPFLLYECYRVFELLFQTGELMPLSTAYEAEGLPASFIVYNWAVLLQASTYMVLTIRILGKYGRYIRDVFSTIDKIRLNWLRNITYMAMVFLTVFLVENVLLLFDINLSNYFNLSSVLAAVYVYALGYLGLFKSEVFSLPGIADSISTLPAFSYQSKLDRQIVRRIREKYEKSGLRPDKAKTYLQDLVRLMQDKEPYTNPDLTLNLLAETLSISPHNLSEIINTQLDRNFFDFVNQYRIEKVKKDLADSEKRHLKILAIAFDAGFNSKSSFNSIFKKHTDLTPSEYRRQVTGRSA